MRNLAIVVVAFLALQAPGIARADDAQTDDDKQIVEVVKGIHTAMLAPTYCHNLATNQSELKDFLTMGNWTPADFTPTGKFAKIGAAVKEYFVGEYTKDKAKACDDAFKALNSGDVKLLVKK